MVFVRAAVVSALFVSLWIWFIPRWLAGGDLHPRWAVLPIVLMVIGGAIMLRCIWDFARTGRGTPAPFDPPRRLVVAGLYRYVRNPMYLGMAIFLVGEALLLPEITREILLVLFAAWAAVFAFIFFYEEPTLRRLFGEDYATYCRNVRRWIPRITPFDNMNPAGVTSPDLE
ncbi:MAG TPA: isoprenylcysteine carboxylmethyltransferase family protein [Thermoanaerobaculia bacterium]|jgi:protein-S-isoprenylcysteine O-methyltransferase Ste14|nr:isoprenylcysteine carboxylmethyltransferase family protein [Thermoanaerobaculia bacterium]